MNDSLSRRDSRPATRSDDVYGQLRTRIITGALRPNERLVEEELADQLQVSRTPVRESFHRLAADGLIVSRRRGWVVREHTLDEIVEIYEVRAALEGMAARLAAQRARAEDLDDIQATYLTTTKSLDLGPGKRSQVVEANLLFHQAIYLLSGNSRLVAQIQRNRDFYFNHRIASLYTDDEMRASWQEHQPIIDALVARDDDAAERRTREHLFTGLSLITSRLAAA